MYEYWSANVDNLPSYSVISCDLSDYRNLAHLNMFTPALPVRSHLAMHVLLI